MGGVKAARNVLRSSELVCQMLSDWKEIDIGAITDQCLWAVKDQKDVKEEEEDDDERPSAKMPKQRKPK